MSDNDKKFEAIFGTARGTPQDGQASAPPGASPASGLPYQPLTSKQLRAQTHAALQAFIASNPPRRTMHAYQDWWRQTGCNAPTSNTVVGAWGSWRAALAAAQR
jgi:hypothetical protein